MKTHELLITIPEATC